MAGYKKVFSFQLRLRYLLASAFIAGLAFSSIVDAKAEENICYFSNRKEHTNCYGKKNIELIPKFPFDSANKSEMHESLFIGSIPLAGVGRQYKVLEFSSQNGKDLQFKIKKLVVGFFAPKEISEEIENIYSNEVISWDRSLDIDGLFGAPFYYFTVKFINNLGNTQSIKYQVFAHCAFQFPGNDKCNKKKSRYADLHSVFFRATTKLEKGESRSRDNILKNRLKRTIKKYEIIQSIIKVETSTNKECIELNKDKYPDLVEKYFRLSKKINPLRAKINLGPSNTIKPICPKR